MGFRPRGSFLQADCKCGWLYLAAIPLLSTILLAQNPSPAGTNLTVHDLAQRVDRHYNQLRSLKCGFTQTYDGFGMKRSESGTLFIVKPGRMKWDYTSPEGKLFLLDGSYSLFYSPGDPQVQRIPTKELDDLRSPMRLLLGHTKLEKELDHLALKTGPGDRYTLTGIPRGLEKRIARLALVVTADGTITSIEIEETDGALTRFLFTDEKPNAAIPQGTFHFVPPPGVPILDALPPA